MKKFALACYLLAFVGAAVGQGSFTHLSWIMAAVIYVLVPILVLLVSVRLSAGRGPKSLKKIPAWLKPAFYGVVIIAIAMAVSMAGGTLVNRWQMDRTLSFVSTAVPVLEGIKKETGAYPEQLPAALAEQLPAWLKAPQSGYQVVNGSYKFTFTNAASRPPEGRFAFIGSELKWKQEKQES